MTSPVEPIRFFLPGPTYVPEDARQAMTAPMVAHRSPAFKEVYADVTGRLRSVFRTAGEVYVATGSSTLVMDMSACVALLDTPGLSQLEAQELLINHLNDLLLFGAMSDGLKADIRAAFALLPSWYDTTPERQLARARMAAWLVLNSPEFFNQR